MMMHGMFGRRTGRPIALGAGEISLSLFQSAAPDLGPGQCRKQEEKREYRDPEARHRMQIAPEPLSARIKHAGQPSVAGPPEKEPGPEQHDAPGADRLDQNRASLSRQQFAMDLAGPFRETALLRFGSQDAQIVGSDINAKWRTGAVDHQHPSGIGRIGPPLHRLDPRRRQSGFGGGDLLIQRMDRPLQGEMAVSARRPFVERRFEQIDHPRHRQHQHEGQSDDPGIEMPAPDTAIPASHDQNPALMSKVKVRCGKG